MNCEKCRFYNPIYRSVGVGCWQICEFCMLGGCDGLQYEPKDGKMDEVEE